MSPEYERKLDYISRIYDGVDHRTLWQLRELLIEIPPLELDVGAYRRYSLPTPEDYLKRERIWSAFDECRHITIHLTDGQWTLDVTVEDGDSFDGRPLGTRWRATWILTDQMCEILIAQIDRAFRRRLEWDFELHERLRKTVWMERLAKEILKSD